MGEDVVGTVVGILLVETGLSVSEDGIGPGVLLDWVELAVRPNKNGPSFSALSFG